MMNIYRARPVAADRCWSWRLAGCSTSRTNCLSPQQPGVIGPERSVRRRRPMRCVSARSRDCKTATVGTAGTETMCTMGGLLTDEWKSGDTFSQRERDGPAHDPDRQRERARVLSGAQQQARGAAKDAIEALRQVPSGADRRTSRRCTGRWVSPRCSCPRRSATASRSASRTTAFRRTANPMTNAEGYRARVGAHRFGARARDGDGHVRRQHAVQPARHQGPHPDRLRASSPKRLRCGGVGSDGVSLVRDVRSRRPGDNPMWSFNTSQKRWVVGDSFDVTGLIKNALPFASAKDPRVPVTGTSVNSSLKLAFDNRHATS